MTREYFIELLQYDKWANQKVALALTQSDEIPSKCKVLFYHISAATEVWLSRVIEIDKHYKSLFEDGDPKTDSEILTTLENKWIEFLKNTKDDIRTVIKYKNTKGNEYENTLQDILTQLLTHNHYHRGQINQLLRQNNLEPAVTDYIVYKRE